MIKAVYWFVPILALSAVVITTCQVSPSARVDAVRAEQLREHINMSTLALMPVNPSNFNLFDTYSTNESLWARGWVGKLDFTGIALDQVRTCTLISPRHVLMAQHYQRAEGATMVFHDRAGRPIVRIIENKLALPGGLMPDIAVALLDQPVPVRFFRVLPPRDDYSTLLAGALVIATDQERNLLPRRIASISNRRVRFQKAADFAEPLAQPLITGDSGNPSFVIINGEPVLIETHTFGGFGQGPFLSDPANYAGINELMATLGGGYQLTPFPLAEP